MSPTTLARKAKKGRLNSVGRDRLVALLAVFERAVSLFEGDSLAAFEWMSTPGRGLGSKRPLNMLRTRMETQAVLDFIGQREEGVLI